MTCPICNFPGNAPNAPQCANCGSALPPASYPVSPMQSAPPVPDPYAMPGQAYYGAPVSPPVSPMQSAPPDPYAMPGQAYYGAPVSPPASPMPISVTPVSGTPQPGYYQPVKPRGSRVVPLTVIVVVLVIASTVIAVVRLTGGNNAGGNKAGGGTSITAGPTSANGSPTQQTEAPPPATTGAATNGDPKAQAAAVDAILDASISSRTKLNAAIDLVNKCTLIEKAISDLQTVGVERQDQIDHVSRFDLSAIAQGEQLRSMLKEALGYSLAADRSFVPWAQAVQGSGCSGGGDGYYAEAQRQSKNASDAKTRFLGVWNPVAAQYGLRNRSSNDI